MQAVDESLLELLREAERPDLVSAAVNSGDPTRLVEHWDQVMQALPRLQPPSGHLNQNLIPCIARLDRDKATELLHWAFESRLPKKQWFLGAAARAGLEVPQEQWLPLFDDPDEETRAYMCKYVGRLAGENPPVASLLQALKDPYSKVQKAASEALDLIRQYRAESEYWANASAPNALPSPAAAARALLIDAKDADNSVMVRSLAIRGLGALGRPEVIPALLTIVKDKPDPELTKAAEDAILAIQKIAAQRPPAESTPPARRREREPEEGGDGSR